MALNLDRGAANAEMTVDLSMEFSKLPEPRPDVMDFLLSRRSRPAKTLKGPAPGRAALELILRAAARSPDHGKLEPWRFIVLEGAALSRLGQLTRKRAIALNLAPEQVEKAASQFLNSPLCVVVVAAPKPSAKVPEREQILSAGAVCLSLLNAALASGWGANWLTAWMAADREFLTEGLELEPEEFVAGFLHIGTQTNPPPERPRPDLEKIISWVSK